MGGRESLPTTLQVCPVRDRGKHRVGNVSGCHGARVTARGLPRLPGHGLAPVFQPRQRGPQDPCHPLGYREDVWLCLALAGCSEQRWIHTELPQTSSPASSPPGPLPAPHFYSFPLFFFTFPFSVESLPSLDCSHSPQPHRRGGWGGARTPQCNREARTAAHAPPPPGRPQGGGHTPSLHPGLQAGRLCRQQPVPPAGHQCSPVPSVPRAEGKLRKPTSPLG